MERPQELFDKYPSLKKFEELGEAYVESHDGREQALLTYIKNRPDYKALQGNPSKLLQAVDEFAGQQDFLINIGSDKGRIVTKIIAEEQPQVLVELGGYIGYSAILFAEQLQRAANASTAHLWSLEFEPEFAKVATELIAIAGLTETVTIITGPADESLRKLKTEKMLNHIDFLFLDHVEDLYVQDFKVCEALGLLKPGTCVVADNVLRPGAPEYRDFVRSHQGLKSQGVKGLIMPGEFEDELEVSKVL